MLLCCHGSIVSLIDRLAGSIQESNHIKDDDDSREVRLRNGTSYATVYAMLCYANLIT